MKLWIILPVPVPKELDSSRGHEDENFIFTSKLYHYSTLMYMDSASSQLIQSPHDDRWTMIKRKLKWMTTTLVAPEITCAVELRQWQESREILKEMRERGDVWSMVRGFYATMRGYVLHHQASSFRCYP